MENFLGKLENDDGGDDEINEVKGRKENGGYVWIYISSTTPSPVCLKRGAAVLLHVTVTFICLLRFFV